MKSTFFILSFLLCTLFSSLAQSVNLRSFQHVVRWINESNFPAYITHKEVQDSLLEHVSLELKRHFKTDSVNLPGRIDYRNITGFGKASIKTPDVNGEDYEVAVLSFISRATAGYAVNWKMQVVATQKGVVVYSRETNHELEYFTASGYLSSMPWFTDESFIKLYTELLAELFEDREAFPAKILVGSKEDNEKVVKEILPTPVSLMLKTNGNILGGGNFILSLQNEKDTLATVLYKDGWDQSWPKLNLSGVAASLFNQLTGITIGYNSKTKEKRFGRLNYTNGREIRLQMEWIESTEKATDGSFGESYPVTPMVLEAHEEGNLAAYFTFYKDFFDGKKQYSLLGRIGGDSIAAAYNLKTGLLQLSENGIPKVVVILDNLNPESRSFSNTKLSKNKIFVSSSSGNIGKARFKEPEWYAFYAEQNLPEPQLVRYMDVVLCLFFGMGNQF